MRIGVLTGGGDVPGLNPCLQALAREAHARGWSVTGFRQGWLGVLSLSAVPSPDEVALWTVDLTPERVRGIDTRGGTILHTSRVDPRTHAGTDRTDHVRAVLAALGIDVMVTLGGDGTLRFTAHLDRFGVPVIAIPKTMDNDVFGTDYCIGFSTAVTRSVDAINALRTTVASHARIGVIELFGRRSGETALLAGFLAQADRTVIAEVPADPEALIGLLAADRALNPDLYALLVISEGATLLGEAADDTIARSGTARDGLGVGTRLARRIEARTGHGTVVQELAYLMRSGTPDALDRLVGFAFGALAVQLIEHGTTGRMLAVRDGNYTHVPVREVEARRKQVDVAGLYDAAIYRPRIARVDGRPMFLG
jgi:6-phosphofructokinase 1